MKLAPIFSLIFLVTVVKCSKIPRMTQQPGCQYEGKWYPEGHFQADPCNPCDCHNGRVSCAIVDCPMLHCVDPKYYPDQCCPSCSNGQNCRTPNGKILSAGQTVQLDDGTTCVCPAQGAGPEFMSTNDAMCYEAPALS